MCNLVSLPTPVRPSLQDQCSVTSTTEGMNCRVQSSCTDTFQRTNRTNGKDMHGHVPREKQDEWQGHARTRSKGKTGRKARTCTDTFRRTNRTNCEVMHGHVPKDKQDEWQGHARTRSKGQTGRTARSLTVWSSSLIASYLYFLFNPLYEYTVRASRYFFYFHLTEH
jgi:hypothetical protein